MGAKQSVSKESVSKQSVRMQEDALIPAQNRAPSLRHRLAGMFTRWRKASVELVYPPQCVACEVATSDAFGLCPVCWTSVPFISAPYCTRLGTPFAVDYGMALLSPAAIADPPRFEKGRAVALHRGIARELIARFKYGERLDLAPVLARMMHAAGRDVLSGADLIVPVPMHPLRLWRRRYNQAAILAQCVGNLSQIRVDLFVLERQKRTKAQVGLTRSQRRSNLAGAFRVCEAKRVDVAGKHVVVIDDVRTTGSTLNACAHMLTKAGAARVDVLTFTLVAHGAHEPVEPRASPFF